MRLQNTSLAALSSLIVLFSWSLSAQTNAYKKKKSAPKAAAAAVVNAASAPPVTTPGEEVKSGSEKLDIQELEQKYWAPKDTDFSVVQNRTYAKSKRVAASLLMGPVVNDTFNEGLATALNVNYYFDERYGVELMYQESNFKDSSEIKKFVQLSGGGVRPDFNRDTGFYGVGFNWVPFYAKMSFLGKKIIYFDMQVTPFLGMTSYEQQSDVKTPDKSAFAYGVDVTQYFFFSKHFAVRANLHNRFYKSDVLAYSGGAVARKNDSTSTTMFLMGLTYFF